MLKKTQFLEKMSQFSRHFDTKMHEIMHFNRSNLKFVRSIEFDEIYVRVMKLRSVMIVIVKIDQEEMYFLMSKYNLHKLFRLLNNLFWKFGVEQ